MEEKRRKHIDPALLAATQRLTPEQRLEAFLTHCRLIMSLHAEGKRLHHAAGRPNR